MAAKLHEFIKTKGPNERVFGLSPESLGMKMKQLAKKAGLSDFHAHTLRHKFDTDVLESGTNVKVLQSLLGHENLNTTEVYLSITNKDLYAAAKRLDEHNNRPIKGKVREKADSVLQPVNASTTINASGSSGEPWAAALRVMLDPTNLCQVLEPAKVEELQLDRLPLIKKTVVLRGLSGNNARRRNLR